MQIYDSVSILMLKRTKNEQQKAVIWFAIVMNESKNKSGIRQNLIKKIVLMYVYEPEKVNDRSQPF